MAVSVTWIPDPPTDEADWLAVLEEAADGGQIRLSRQGDSWTVVSAFTPAPQAYAPGDAFTMTHDVVEVVRAALQAAGFQVE
jgi:hypothetical protein